MCIIIGDVHQFIIVLSLYTLYLNENSTINTKIIMDYLLQGTVVVTDESGATIFQHSVEAGDIWRMCQTKDAPIKVDNS